MGITPCSAPATAPPPRPVPFSPVATAAAAASRNRGTFCLFLGIAVATVLYAKGVSSTGQSILFFGFLMALGNSQRRTFHDNIAGTVVIRPTRASWSIDDEERR